MWILWITTSADVAQRCSISVHQSFGHGFRHCKASSISLLLYHKCTWIDLIWLRWLSKSTHRFSVFHHAMCAFWKSLVYLSKIGNSSCKTHVVVVELDTLKICGTYVTMFFLILCCPSSMTYKYRPHTSCAIHVQQKYEILLHYMQPLLHHR